MYVVTNTFDAYTTSIRNHNLSLQCLCSAGGVNNLVQVECFKLKINNL